MFIGAKGIIQSMSTQVLASPLIKQQFKPASVGRKKDVALLNNLQHKRRVNAIHKKNRNASSKLELNRLQQMRTSHFMIICGRRFMTPSHATPHSSTTTMRCFTEFDWKNMNFLMTSTRQDLWITQWLHFYSAPRLLALTLTHTILCYGINLNQEHLTSFITWAPSRCQSPTACASGTLEIKKEKKKVMERVLHEFRCFQLGLELIFLRTGGIHSCLYFHCCSIFPLTALPSNIARL